MWSLEQNKQSRSKAHHNNTNYFFVIHIKRIPWCYTHSQQSKRLPLLHTLAYLPTIQQDGKLSDTLKECSLFKSKYLNHDGE
jgi:hypothetical protein